jgi:hypothetical protein
VFEGLFPDPHNRTILNLLFTCAHWHSLAKLRLHTDATLEELEATTTLLGQKFKDFESKSCAAYQTYELPKEAEKRQRATAKKATRTSTPPASKGKRKADTSTSEQLKLGRKKVNFSLSTYKYHSLGDYVANIKMYGTCDSYSTELVGGSTSKTSSG